MVSVLKETTNLHLARFASLSIKSYKIDAYYPIDYTTDCAEVPVQSERNLGLRVAAGPILGPDVHNCQHHIIWHGAVNS